MMGDVPIKLSRLDTVERFFAGTGGSYDSMVAWGTCGLDRLWKARLLARVPRDAERIVDQACGTGILTIALARRHPACQITGVELRDEYLRQARDKVRALDLPNVSWRLGRAEDVHVEGGQDCVVSSYLAKYADLDALIGNTWTMLRPGGRVILHDFAYPARPGLRMAWEAYFRVMSTLARRTWPEWNTVFDELPALLRSTRWVQETREGLARAGFVEVEARPLTLGAAALVWATKPPPSPTHRTSR